MSCCPNAKPCSSCNNLTCNLCGKCFPYEPECVGQLGQHCCKEHWLHKISHFVQRSSRNQAPMEVQWISNAKVNVRRLKHENFINQYKTTMESWHDGPTALRCCECGYAGAPYIRKQKHKIASTRFGQSLLMACWPIFFAPLTTKQEISLFCKQCGAFFGCYDPESGCLIQNCSSDIDCRMKCCRQC